MKKRDEKKLDIIKGIVLGLFGLFILSFITTSFFTGNAIAGESISIKHNQVIQLSCGSYNLNLTRVQNLSSGYSNDSCEFKNSSGLGVAYKTKWISEGKGNVIIGGKSYSIKMSGTSTSPLNYIITITPPAGCTIFSNLPCNSMGASCTSNSDCCSNSSNCVSNKCQQCKGIKKSCMYNRECCSGFCKGYWPWARICA